MYCIGGGADLDGHFVSISSVCTCVREKRKVLSSQSIVCLLYSPFICFMFSVHRKRMQTGVSPHVSRQMRTCEGSISWNAEREGRERNLK